MAHSLDRQALSPELSHDGAMPLVQEVSPARVFAWLQLGARDLAQMPRISLEVGAAVALAGVALVAAAWKATYLAPALLGGFLLVAPFLALPLYALSRQRENGEPADAGMAWRAWRENAGSIALFGLMLAIAYLFWERAAAIVFAFHYTGQPLNVSRLPAELLSGSYGLLLFSFLTVGGLLAAAVFALSVVSAPLLLDRPVDVITAAVTSVRCCLRNPATMLLWAVVIASLTVVGFATLMIGLVVIFPLLAHASWHAYRELVG